MIINPMVYGLPGSTMGIPSSMMAPSVNFHGVPTGISSIEGAHTIHGAAHTTGPTMDTSQGGMHTPVVLEDEDPLSHIGNLLNLANTGGGN